MPQLRAPNLGLSGGVAAGAPGSFELRIDRGSPYSLRLEWGTDGSGYRYTIAKNQAGVITDQLWIAEDGTLTTLGGHLPSTDGIVTLGSAAKRWADVRTMQAIIGSDPGGTEPLRIGGGVRASGAFTGSQVGIGGGISGLIANTGTFVISSIPTRRPIDIYLTSDANVNQWRHYTVASDGVANLTATSRQDTTSGTLAVTSTTPTSVTVTNTTGVATHIAYGIQSAVPTGL